MTHPNFQTNGASLEDCHTNFFALTELSGIKWRKLVYCDLGGGTSSAPGHCGGLGGGGAASATHHNEPLDDPVLSSYSRCLAADILCVWRRVSTPSRQSGSSGGDGMFDVAPPPPPPPLSLATSKELWIFWYGEEPDLNLLISPELNTPDCEQGSWESGLSYECRSLLFKALHNLIERCLLSRDFIRLGKWFVQPYDGPHNKTAGLSASTATSTSATHLSFSFAFFVHGESSVCASVDVRQHPPVRRLTRHHVQQAQSSLTGLKVILAPFGLAGTLTGQSFNSPDYTNRLLDEWNRFFPLDKNTGGPNAGGGSSGGGGNNSGNSGSNTSTTSANGGGGSGGTSDNNLVEVIVGGVKMKYPACYVLVTDLDDNCNQNVLNSGQTAAAAAPAVPNNSGKNGTSSPIQIQTPPPSPIQINSRVPQPGPYSVSCEHPLSMSRDETAATVLPERVWQECVHGGPPGGGGGTQNMSSAGHHTPASTSSSSSSSSSMTTSATTMQQLQQHHEFNGQWDFVDPTKRANCTCSKCSSGSYTPQGGPPSYPRTQESVAIPSVGSPPSAPSPLPNSHSQPASVPPGDQTMPMLSPHPPTMLPSPIDQKTTLTTTTTPPDHHHHLLNSQQQQQQQQQLAPKSIESAANSPSNTNSCQIDVKNQEQESNNNSSGHNVILKRPILSVKEYESSLGDEEQTLEMLYDYTTLDAWLNHPVKRFKPDGKESKRNANRISKMDIYTLYNTHNGGVASLNNNNNNNNNNNELLNNTKYLKEIKQEPGECGPITSSTTTTNDSTTIHQTSLSHGIKRPGDPYEFDEEGASSACTMDGFKRSAAAGGGPITTSPTIAGGQHLQQSAIGATTATTILIKEEPKDSKKLQLTGNYYTNEGLQPSLKDLDQIFDNSDDTSSDETMQTPPGSTPLNHHDMDGGKRLSSGGGGAGHGTCSTMGILRPEELSKMFPTPPSLEHNPIASPCGGQLELPLTDYTDLQTSGGMMARTKQEIYPNMGSPQEENIDDWSFVFRPPAICKMVGSSKYAPLTNLPSQNLPAVSLPSHCVYKPSWIQHAEKPPPSTQQPVQQAPQQQMLQNVMPATTPSSHQMQNSLTMQQAAQFQQQQQHHHQFPPSPLHGFRQPPPPYELPSPAASTASSYLNKNLNSVEAAMTPTATQQQQQTSMSGGATLVQRQPEANSLALNILLTDTASNIFRDHNFDSCTLCVCNAIGRVAGNIRGADAGLYLNNSTCDKFNMFGGGGGHVQPNSPYGMMGGQQQHHQPPPPPYGGMLSPQLSQQQHHQQQQHHLHQQHQQQQQQQQHMMIDEDGIRCSCGFSAVVNRKLAYGSGLFYEDEMEITGIAEDPGEKKKASLLSFLMQSSSIKLDPNIDREQIDVLPHGLLELIREQCVFIPSTANSLFRAARYIRKKSSATSSNTSNSIAANPIHVLEYKDSHEVTIIALEQSKNLYDTLSMCKMEDYQQKIYAKTSMSYTVHRWPFLRANGPQCNQDIVRVMNALQPLLQEAIQKKCQTRLWEAPSAVKGPLTWRQFHRLAGRGTDDRCEPQPIPSVVVGHDKDWLSLSPYAIQHWESLLLEPYSFARDVAYIVVAPDNDAILPRVRTFFKELSTAYEMCKLGRHSPITKVLRDGILRVGKTAKAKIGNEPIEEWFTMLGESEIGEMLRLYAQVCKHHLAPHLQQVPMDKTLLDPPQDMGGNGTNSGDKGTTASPMPPPPNTPDTAASNVLSTATTTGGGGLLLSGGGSEKAPNTPKSESDADQKDGSNSQQNTPTTAMVENQYDEDEREIPSVVVYLVEPFSMGSDQPELQRLACLALLRCFQSVLAAVPENIRNNISVQIISLESIVELGKARDRTRHSDHMRALSLNIFSQCRRLLIHSNNVKSLTGFGTAAMADLFLKSKDEKNRAAYKLYTPPYILAPMREKVEAVESFGKGSGDQASVLYLSYCLSEDQSWLLAVATDERGEIFETVTINIDIPNRIRRKKASARRIGLEKLMNFIVGVMSQSVRPWRLVVGRLGRIGHGELKGWSWLLSKKNLLKASKHLKEICNQCSLLYPSSVPCILSACLVSLEPDSVLRLMPDQFTPDERFSQVSVNSQLSTPQDVSCTHILVFPTSATTQSSQTAFQEQHITPELGDDELFSALNDDMPEGIDGMNDFSDIFNWPETGPGGGQSPTGSPRREESGPGSPTCGMNNGRQGSPFQCGGTANSKGADQIEEVGTLLQQPLALGYYVSTAPTGHMPKWFWSSCPHLEGVCPAFLKNALHLHSPNIQQNSDDLFQQSAVTSHPLDSQYTTDVLRYVLEGYNALSWLALDSNTRDRLSCLPVHMQVLVQLYHTTAALL